MDFVTKGELTRSFDRFKQICQHRRKSWKCLSKELNRPYVSIARRWGAFVEPTILAHLCGMTKFQWKRNFFQFVVDSKALGVGDINWKLACEKWPFCTKGSLFNSLLSCYAMKKGLPLYKILEPQVKNASFDKNYFERRIALAEAYEDMLVQKENI